MSYTLEYFFGRVLGRLGIAAPPNVPIALAALAKVESDPAIRSVNPLDTTWGTGSPDPETPLDSRVFVAGLPAGWWNRLNGYGVAVYASQDAGVIATAKTLSSDYYRHWRAVLKSGVWSEDARPDMRTWGFSDSQIQVFRTALAAAVPKEEEPMQLTLIKGDQRDEVYAVDLAGRKHHIINLYHLDALVDAGLASVAKVKVLPQAQVDAIPDAP